MTKGRKFTMLNNNGDSDEEEGDGTEILTRKGNNISFLFMRFRDIQTI